MSQLPTKQRIEYFDYLRLLASLAVVTIHICSPYWFSAPVNTYQWKVLALFESLSRWSVPVFFMISGSLFLSSSQNIRKILTKNLRHIVTAFLFWSAVYTFICYIEGEYTLRESIPAFLLGHFHMWYLYAIAGLYLAVPILLKVVQCRESTKYFLVMAFLFGCLFPQVAVWSGRIIPWTEEYLMKIHTRLSIDTFCGYSLYFVLGWYLHTTDFSAKHRKVIYILGTTGMLFTVIMTWTLSYCNQTPIHIFLDYLTPNTFFVSIAVFVFAKYHFRYGNLSPKAISLLQRLSRYSFGVYLVHPLLYDVLLYQFGYDLMSQNILFSVSVTSLGIYAASFLFSGLIHQIPILKKLIV